MRGEREIEGNEGRGGERKRLYLGTALYSGPVI